MSNVSKVIAIKLVTSKAKKWRKKYQRERAAHRITVARWQHLDKSYMRMFNKNRTLVNTIKNCDPIVMRLVAERDGFRKSWRHLADPVWARAMDANNASLINRVTAGQEIARLQERLITHSRWLRQLLGLSDTQTYTDEEVEAMITEHERDLMSLRTHNGS